MSGPDPSTHFRDSENRPDPLWVRHDTGRPEWAETAAGLVPFSGYAAALPKPAPSAGQSFEASAGGFAFSLSVTNPGGPPA